METSAERSKVTLAALSESTLPELKAPLVTRCPIWSKLVFVIMSGMQPAPNERMWLSVKQDKQKTRGKICDTLAVIK